MKHQTHKRYALSWLLVLALLAGLLAAMSLTAWAEGGDPVTLFVKSDVSYSGGSVPDRSNGETYKTIADALEKAEPGDTIQLKSDITENVSISSGDITLDLNGHILQAGTGLDSFSYSVIYVEQGKLTITDTSEGETGKITGGKGTCMGSGTEAFGGGILNGGTLTIEGGTITGNTADYGGGILNLGTLTITGGSITGNTAQYGGGVCNGLSTECYKTLESMEGKSVSKLTLAFTKESQTASYSASFTMTGGTITGNTAERLGGGVYNGMGAVVTITPLKSVSRLTPSALGLKAKQLTVIEPAPASFTMSANDDGEGLVISGNRVVSEIEVNDIGPIFVGDSSDFYGAGVYNSGIMKMDAGTISENSFYITNKETNQETDAGTYGGGIYNTGSLTMTGGTISGNSAEYGGGVYSGTYSAMNILFSLQELAYAACKITDDIRYSMTEEQISAVNDWMVDHAEPCVTFDMTGGEITGNRANYLGGGVYNGVMGDDLPGSHGNELRDKIMPAFTMSGSASVSGNRSDRDSGYGAYGGGVFNFGVMKLTGNGTISGNTAQCDGGGIMNAYNLYISGGSITGNTADGNGGGICNTNGVIEMTGGSITGNTADSNGGGICNTAFYMGPDESEEDLQPESRSLSLRSVGGTTTKVLNLADTAPAASAEYEWGAFVTILGGSITGNTAGGSGDGVYVGEDAEVGSSVPMSGTISDYEARLTLGGSAQITDNGENVYLPEGKLVTIAQGDDAPESGMRVGITTEQEPTEAEPIAFTAEGNSEYLNRFFSDSSSYTVSASKDGALQLEPKPNEGVLIPRKPREVIEEPEEPKEEPEEPTEPTEEPEEPTKPWEDPLTPKEEDRIEELREKFQDIRDDDELLQALATLYPEGIMIGMSDSDFGADETLTRAMMTTVMYRMAGGAEVLPAEGNGGFTDVPLDQWYTQAIAWAAERGYVKGYGDGRFGPDDPITVEQLVVIFYRYAGSPTPAYAEDDTFTTNASSWARDAIQWAHENGLLEDLTLMNPTGSATRRQTAIFLYRYGLMVDVEAFAARELEAWQSRTEEPVLDQAA